MLNKFIILIVITISILNAKKIPQKDIEIRVGDSVRFGTIDAKMVYFGGYTTSECKLAISNDGKYFYLKKVNSNCKKLTNSKGIKIICNLDKSVCKTRSELKEFINNTTSSNNHNSNNNLTNNTKMPTWCNSSNLNKTEHTICANEVLNALDNRLAEVYGANKAKNSDNEQKEWLKKRNKCGSDISCIKKIYNERIDILQDKNKKNQNEISASEDIATTGLDILKELCNKDSNSFACMNVGIAYEKGKSGVSADVYEAIRYYKKACNLNYAKGCRYVGIMYANGKSVSRDLQNALYYLRKACNKNDNESCSDASKVRNMLANEFRGVSKNKCYQLSNYGVQNICLKGTGGSECYGLKDYGIQRVCKEGAGGDACYGLKDYGMQRVCKEGIRTDACYSLKDYNMQNSCRNFSGSTTFWLILATHGYYVR